MKRLIDSLTVAESTAATRRPLPVRTSITPFAASARTASRITVRETPNCSPSSRSEGSRSPACRPRAWIVSSRRSATLSESRGSRVTRGNVVFAVGSCSARVASRSRPKPILRHAVRQANRPGLADLQLACDLLVDLDSEPRRLRQRDRAVLRPRRPGEQLPEELVAGVRLGLREVLDERTDARGAAEDHVQVVRLVRVGDDGEARRLRESADLQCLGDSSDTVHVGLEDVDGAQLDQLPDLPLRVQVLAAAPALPRAAPLQLRVPREVVREERLLDPGEVELAKPLRRFDRVAEIPAHVRDR